MTAPASASDSTPLERDARVVNTRHDHIRPGEIAIGVIIGNVIYPRMQGRSLNIDPVVVLVSLAFWSAIWGVTGAFLSTPLTVMAMVVLAQFDGSRWIAVILSADGDPQQLRTRMAPDPPEDAEKPVRAHHGRAAAARRT